MILNVSFSIWKQVVQNHTWTVYHLIDGNNRTIWTGHTDRIYKSYVSKEDFTDWQTNFEAASVMVSLADDAIAQIVGLSGQKDLRNADGILYNSNEPRLGSNKIFVTHNLCDPTTWFGESVRVTDETLSSVDGYVWTGNNPIWIDLTHGKFFNEDTALLKVSHGYSVDVKVDGYSKTERIPFAESGGDYIVNYSTGTVTFVQDQSGKTVVASYSHENGSRFIIAPDAGKYIDMEIAEVQFSGDLIFNDSVDFEIWVYNPFDLPNKIMYLRMTYKTLDNFIDEALGSYPATPAMGGIKRGISSAKYGFPFHYNAIRRLKSSEGTELHIKLRSDIAHGGEGATGTFYCTSHDE